MQFQVQNVSGNILPSSVEVGCFVETAESCRVRRHSLIQQRHLEMIASRATALVFPPLPYIMCVCIPCVILVTFASLYTAKCNRAIFALEVLPLLSCFDNYQQCFVEIYALLSHISPSIFGNYCISE